MRGQQIEWTKERDASASCCRGRCRTIFGHSGNVMNCFWRLLAARLPGHTAQIWANTRHRHFLELGCDCRARPVINPAPSSSIRLHRHHQKINKKVNNENARAVLQARLVFCLSTIFSVTSAECNCRMPSGTWKFLPLQSWAAFILSNT